MHMDAQKSRQFLVLLDIFFYLLSEAVPVPNYTVYVHCNPEWTLNFWAATVQTSWVQKPKPDLLGSSHTIWQWSQTKLQQWKCGYSSSIGNNSKFEAKLSAEGTFSFLFRGPSQTGFGRSILQTPPHPALMTLSCQNITETVNRLL